MINNCFKILILLSILNGIQCQASKDNSDLLAILGILPEQNSWKAIFSYPGRSSSMDKREQAKQEIISIIRSTEKSLEIHAYGLTDADIVKEIAQARERYVSVKIVADSERSYDLLKAYKIPYSIWKGSGLHHIKVILSDNKKMFTGTGNFTSQGLLTDYDGYFTFSFPQSVGQDFSSLINERYNYPVLSWNGFYFYNSPDNGRHIQKRILDEIRNAKRSIQYLIYSHSDPLLSQELIRASKRGVLVEGIYDRPISDQGKILATILPQWNSRIYEEENEDRIDDSVFGLGGLNHHKTIIIDDEILFSGSYNFSLNARDSNREIFYETKNPLVIQEYSQEFIRVKNSSRIYPESWTELEELTHKSKYVFEYGDGIYRSLGISSNSKIGNFHPVSSGLFAGGRKIKDLAWIQESKLDLNFEPAQLPNFTTAEDWGKFHSAAETIQLLALDSSHSLGSVFILQKELDLRRAHLWTWNLGWISQDLVKLSNREYLWLGNSLKTSNKAAWIVLEKNGGNGYFYTCIYQKGKTLPSELEFLSEENQIQNIFKFHRKVDSCSEI